ncbi:right-handed parallel beta-helix repeat-containing protein [Vibrio aquaticus]|nr:right-handed parallel beta-helix repeat-containing protein [Vibrio aquaticus]
MNIEVELRNDTFWFPRTYTAHTGGDGQFYFDNIPNGTYTLSLPSTRGSDKDGDIYSERGECFVCLPIQTWPNITEDYTRTVVVNGFDVDDAHIGFNYSSVTNENDDGVGSLRQFFVNSQSLTSGRDRTWITKSSLNQEGHTDWVDNAIFAKPISSITLRSPLEFIDSNRTYIDARVLLDGPRPLTISNFRSQPINEDYGLRVTDSYSFVVAGINWNRFDDSIYVLDSHGVQLVDNSFNDTRDSGAIIYDSHDIEISDNHFNNTVNKEERDEQAAGLFLSRSDRVSVLRNQFVDTGDDHRSDGAHSWHVSGVRVLYGNENKISQNTFKNTKGMAIDLRYVEDIGVLTPNDGEYNWANDVSNYAIDFPEFTSVTSGGDIQGGVKLDNLTSYNHKCDQTYQDIKVEVYLAQGDALDSTIEGTHYLGDCSLDSAGSIESCDIDTSQLHDGVQVTSIAIDKCGNTSEMGQAFGVQASDYDYGDAPNEDLFTGWGNTQFEVLSEDNGARHALDETKCLISSTLSGSTSCTFSNDSDDDGQPDRQALGDLSGDTILDYDDGVLINPALEQQSGKKIVQTSYLEIGNEVVVSNTLSVTTTSAGYVSAWLDINQDGQWQAFDGPSGQYSEQLTLTGPEITQAGTYDLSFSIPSYAVHGESWLRVRFSSQPITEPHGAAIDGEVEDYQVWIAAPSISDGSCSAGIQNPSFEYWTSPNYYDDEFAVPGWNTIPNNPLEGSIGERNQLEFDNHNTYNIVPSPDNKQNSRVAELNAHIAGTLYQDVVTQPGQTIRWSFDYIERNNSMPWGAVQQLSLLLGSSDNFDRHNSDLIQISPVATEEWTHYTNTYVVPEGQYITRLAFKAELPSTGSVGNVIDNVVFGCEVGKDYGDLPSAFENEQKEIHRAISSLLYIGHEPPDAEDGNQDSDLAKGDDANGFNDENTFKKPIVIPRGSDIEIKDIPIYNHTGKAVSLDVAIDLVDEGTPQRFDTFISLGDIPSLATTQYVSVTLNQGREWTSRTQSVLRLVLSGENPLPDGIKIGEVEDHPIYIGSSDLLPEPGRCDGFVQVKGPESKGSSEYAKWVAQGGEFGIEIINNALDVNNLKVIGVNSIDGYTYGVGTGENTEHKLYVADQQQGAEFQVLTKLKAARDGIQIVSQEGHTYTFNQGETLDSSKKRDGKESDKLGRTNSGDVSLNGEYMILGRSSWHSLVRVHLATGTFDTIALKGLTHDETVPWSADLAFNPAGATEHVYGLSRDLKTLYKVSIVDGSITPITLTLKLQSGANSSAWPYEGPNGKLAAGGVGINLGGVMFAMTNSGIHDLNQDGAIDKQESKTQTTALYSVDIENQTIRFEMKGVEQETSSNDAGGCAIHADYGDAPESLESNNPAVHLGANSALKLGSLWSADLGPGHDQYASSDSSDDGVVFRDSLGRTVDIENNPLIPGHQYSLFLNVSGGGYFTAWVSWDEKAWEVLPANLTFTVPSNSSRGYVRVRYSSTKQYSATGEAPDGEVEDYYFEVGSALNGISVTAPSSPLTCEVAQYQVTLDADGGSLSQDVNVSVGFENAPAQCWFDATSFNRGQEAGKSVCNTGTKTLLFEAGSPLTRTIYVATDSELVDVTLVATQEDIGSAKDGARFTKEGFNIVPVDTPEHYKAGESFKVRLERKVALEDQVQCSIDPDYLGAKTFAFNHETTDTYKGKLVLDGAEIVNDTDVTLNFNAGVSDTIDGVYLESGYLNILAEYLPEEGLPKTASLDAMLHFKPYSLVVSDVSSSDDSITNPQDSVTRFLPAESEFDIEITAVAKGHTANTPLITRNFDAALASNTGFEATILVPASEAGAVQDLVPNTPTRKVFAGGVLENTFTYANVGTIGTRWLVESYDGYSNLSGFLNTDLSIDNGGERSQVGYFYPAKFVLNSDFSVPTTRADNGEPWTYYGQPNVSVEVEVEAVGLHNGDLSFYDAETLASNELPSLASIDVYFDGDSVPSCLMDEGVLIDSSGSAIDFDQAWQGGRWEVDAGNYAFSRQEACWQQLNDVNLFMDLSNSENSPLVDGSDTVLESSELELGDAIDVRFGRLTLVDVAGPTNQLLPMAINVEFWDGNRFAANDWHSETSLGSLGALPNLDDLDPQPSETSGAVPVVMADSLPVRAVDQGESSTLIGASEAGFVELPWAFATGTENWLGYCWYTVDGITDECGDEESYRQPPSGTATFGVNRGSENIIYIMERFE